ncbi:MAG: nitroreductase family protein [Bacteroidales bacterium]
MMDFLDLAKRRYSCRKYESRRVDPSHLEEVLEAGRIAPSACNNQPWYFIVIEDADNLARIKKCYAKNWLDSAPMLVVVCGDHTQSWKRDDGKDHCDVDIAIAVDHMTLAASSLGLATCWICKFDAVTCSRILGLPQNIEPIVMLPLGYPAGSADPDRHSSLRKATELIVRHEHW